VYKHASFAIFASQSENCPNILLELMASGCAVLCSDMPPMPEFGQDAVIYFNPRSPSDLAEKLEYLVNNHQVIDQLKQKALAHADSFQWTVSAKQTWRALHDVTL